MNSKRIRSGLYQVTTETGAYTVEDYHNGERWVWRVLDSNNYSDPWVGDFDTKREALVELAGK